MSDPHGSSMVETISERKLHETRDECLASRFLLATGETHRVRNSSVFVDTDPDTDPDADGSGSKTRMEVCRLRRVDLAEDK
jgi:hypothetical protein